MAVIVARVPDVMTGCTTRGTSCSSIPPGRMKRAQSRAGKLLPIGSDDVKPHEGSSDG
jgi:hypothetical protein